VATVTTTTTTTTSVDTISDDESGNYKAGTPFIKLDAGDRNGCTALHIAAAGMPQVVKCGKTHFYTTGGGTLPDGDGMQRNSVLVVKIIQKLVKAGCNVTLLNNDAKTALQLAEEAHDVRMQARHGAAKNQRQQVLERKRALMAFYRDKDESKASTKVVGELFLKHEYPVIYNALLAK
jgi:hypothetical protein